MTTQTKKTKKLVTSAILIAISSVLSMITVFRMPWGGSITPFSMLPVMLIGFMYGTGKGVLGAFVYALMQMLIGITATQAFAGIQGINVLFMAVLDYIVAYSVLGLTGLFSKAKNKTAGLVCGVAVTGILRYIAHTLSGILLWSDYAAAFFESTKDGAFGTIFPALSNSILSSTSGTLLATVYSLIYNGLYMIPEILVCIIGATVLTRVLPAHYFEKA